MFIIDRGSRAPWMQVFIDADHHGRRGTLPHNSGGGRGAAVPEERPVTGKQFVAHVFKYAIFHIKPAYNH